MKRVWSILLAVCVVATMALPVSAKDKVLQVSDRSRFRYEYDGQTVTTNSRLRAGTFEPGDEIRLYLDKNDFMADTGSRMDLMTAEDLEKARIRFFWTNESEDVIDAEDLFESVKLKTDWKKKTVYASFKLRSDLPESEWYAVSLTGYLANNGEQLENTVLDIDFVVDAR